MLGKYVVLLKLERGAPHYLTRNEAWNWIDRNAREAGSVIDNVPLEILEKGYGGQIAFETKEERDRFVNANRELLIRVGYDLAEGPRRLEKRNKKPSQ